MIKKIRLLPILFRFIIGGIFIYASIHKLKDPYAFAQIVYSYNILPNNLVNAFALILPWLEIICGFFLMIGFFRQGSILIINFLLVLFAIGIGINLYRGTSDSCGCFGIPAIDKLTFPHLIINFLLLLMGIHIFLHNPKIK